MKDASPGGPCTCIIDAPTARLMDQTCGRYNDRSAFSNNMAMDNQNNMQLQFTATAQNTLEQRPQTQQMSDMMMMLALTNKLPLGTPP